MQWIYLNRGEVDDTVKFKLPELDHRVGVREAGGWCGAESIGGARPLAVSPLLPTKCVTCTLDIRPTTAPAQKSRLADPGLYLLCASPTLIRGQRCVRMFVQFGQLVVLLRSKLQKGTRSQTIALCTPHFRMVGVCVVVGRSIWSS